VKRSLEDVLTNETLWSNSKKGKGGRKPGGRNWTAEEVKILFEAMEEILPCGREIWEAMAAKCTEISVKDWTWNRESSKKIQENGFDESSHRYYSYASWGEEGKGNFGRNWERGEIGNYCCEWIEQFQGIGGWQKHAMALKGEKLLDEEKNVAWRPSTWRSLVRDVTLSFDVTDWKYKIALQQHGFTDEWNKSKKLNSNKWQVEKFGRMNRIHGREYGNNVFFLGWHEQKNESDFEHYVVEEIIYFNHSKYLFVLINY